MKNNYEQVRLKYGNGKLNQYILLYSRYLSKHIEYIHTSIIEFFPHKQSMLCRTTWRQEDAFRGPIQCWDIFTGKFSHFV